MTGLKAYTEQTKNDAFCVIRECFSEGSCRKAEKYLHNPIGGGSISAGDVAYADDVPVGFQAAILRKLFLGKESLTGTVGGMLAMKLGASPVLLVDLMKSTITSRGGSSLFYANTANVASMKMNRLLGVKGMGPATCERIRFAVTYWPRFIKAWVPKPRTCRISSIEKTLFDDFWTRYLQGNTGLVSSRTAEELQWIFGEGVAKGEIVLLGMIEEGRLMGYIALKSTHGGRRWMIVDWIAVNDDPVCLHDLLLSAVRFLRRETSSLMLESVGFPFLSDSIQKRCLPFCRKTKSNSFLWKFQSGQGSIPSNSWFFGPYDGDRCM